MTSCPAGGRAQPPTRRIHDARYRPLHLSQLGARQGACAPQQARPPARQDPRRSKQQPTSATPRLSVRGRPPCGGAPRRCRPSDSSRCPLRVAVRRLPPSARSARCAREHGFGGSTTPRLRGGGWGQLHLTEMRQQVGERDVRTRGEPAHRREEFVVRNVFEGSVVHSFFIHPRFRTSHVARGATLAMRDEIRSVLGGDRRSSDDVERTRGIRACGVDAQVADVRKRVKGRLT